MYESFFNLKKKPFELVPDPEFIYLSRSHKKAMTYLDYGIRERAGFILLTGDVGSGKTTLIRDLLSKKYERMVLAKIFNTRVTSEQLLSMINEDFGLDVAGRDKISLIRDLNDFLLEQFAEGNQPVLIIDEAQNLSAELLEEVRMLSNLESARSKLLQIVLVGQPELRDTLAVPELLQLRQRISINCHLKALSREEVSEYILHRMEVAGNPSALEFTSRTLDIIYQYSRGIPRLMNIICDFLMLSAFAEEVRVVTDEMVLEVVGDLDFENHFWGGEAKPAVPPANSAAAGGSDEPLLRASVPRTDLITADLVERIPDALRAVQEALGSFQEEFKSHVGKSEAQVAELRGSIATVKSALERVALNITETRSGAPGFMRRVIGSASGGK